MSVMNIITRHISPTLNNVKDNLRYFAGLNTLYVYRFWNVSTCFPSMTWVQNYGMFGSSQLYRTERRHPLSQLRC